MSEAIPAILVLGETAAGKSDLAVELALAFGGEIISADAVAVYREMDIGSAKPDPAQRAAVSHHCLDCLDPEDSCDVGRWLALADAAARDIHARGRRVIVAGGSPLYTKAFLEGLSTGAPRDAQLRRELEGRYDERGPAALYAELAAVDPVYAAARHPNDRKRIVRALEVHRLTGRPFSSFHTTDGRRRGDYRTLLLGLRRDRETTNRRINARTKAMFANGLIDEVRRLAPRLSPEARQAVGYKEVIAHLAGEWDREQAIYRVARASRNLAKQQRTWYKRFRDIVWLDASEPEALHTRALDAARAFLADSAG